MVKCVHATQREQQVPYRSRSYEAVLAFLVFFFGDSTSTFRFFLLLLFSLASSRFLDFGGGSTISTSLFPPSGAETEPMGTNRWVSSSGEYRGLGGFWCTIGEDSGEDCGGVGSAGRAEMTSLREMGWGAVRYRRVGIRKKRR